MVLQFNVNCACLSMFENLTTIIQNPVLLTCCMLVITSSLDFRPMLNVRLWFQHFVALLQYISAGFFEYSLEIKWTLNIRPQMEAYYHFYSVSALIVDACKNH